MKEKNIRTYRNNFRVRSFYLYGFLLLLTLISSCSKNGDSSKEGQGGQLDEISNIVALIKNNPLQGGVHYVSEVQINDVNNLVEMWVMGERIKSAIINNRKSTVVISDETYMVTYVSDEKSGMRMKLDGQKAHLSYFDPNRDILTDSIEVLRREKMSGASCLVVKAKHTFDSSDCTLWINVENGFVMRMESLSENGEPMVVVNRDVLFGPVDESVFSVPSEIFIQELQ